MRPVGKRPRIERAKGVTTGRQPINAGGVRRERMRGGAGQRNPRGVLRDGVEHETEGETAGKRDAQAQKSAHGTPLFNILYTVQTAAVPWSTPASDVYGVT
jgi:hypothetical protein